MKKWSPSHKMFSHVVSGRSFQSYINLAGLSVYFFKYIFHKFRPRHCMEDSILNTNNLNVMIEPYWILTNKIGRPAARIREIKAF